MRKAIALMSFMFFIFPMSLISQEMALTVRWATRGPPESPFITVTGVACTRSGDIWVSDTRASTVYVFDDQGSYRHPLGGAGDGPGEFRSPTLISTMSSDRVAVLDLGRRSLEVFGSNGEFIHRVIHGTQVLYPKSFLALPDSSFLITGGIMGKPGSLHRISWDGRLVASVISRPETSDSLASLYLSGGPIARMEDEYIAFSSAFQHRLFTISPSLEVSLFAEDEGVFPPTGDDFIQEEEGLTRYRWSFPRPTGLFVLADGSLLNVITWREMDVSIWERYRRNGELISRSRIPTAYHPWAVLPGGDMVASRVVPDTGESEVLRLGITWN